MLYGVNDMRHPNTEKVTVNSFVNDYGEVIDGLKGSGIDSNNIYLGTLPRIVDYASGSWTGGSYSKWLDYNDSVVALADRKNIIFVPIGETMFLYDSSAIISAFLSHPHDSGAGVIGRTFYDYVDSFRVDKPSVPIGDTQTIHGTFNWNVPIPAVTVNAISCPIIAFSRTSISFRIANNVPIGLSDVAICIGDSCDTINNAFTVDPDVLPQYSVTSTVIGNGASAFIPENDSVSDSNSTVRIYAVYGDSVVFNGFSGDTTGGVRVDDTLMVTMHSDRDITLTFEPDTVQLTVNIVGTGTVTELPAGKSGLYQYGEPCTLVAVYAPPDTVVTWTGAIPAHADTVYLVMNRDRSIVATFSDRLPTSGTRRRGCSGFAPAFNRGWR
jgi:hypothetical protein